MFTMSPIGSRILLSMLLALGARADSNNISSSSSFFPIHVTILSSNGTDLTPSIPVLHSHVPVPTLQRRSSTSTSIRECSVSDENISRSWCQHAISPQAFEAFCREPESAVNPISYVRYIKGNCADEEICIGSETEDSTVPLQAYCVSTTHFLPIGRNTTSGSHQNPDSSGVVTAGFNPALHHDRNGSGLAVQAVVTAPDKSTSLFATSVVMQAQKFDGVWRTEPDGQAYCKECSSVRLAQFPAAARRVKVDVVLPESTPAGLLWLASFRYE